MSYFAIFHLILTVTDSIICYCLHGKPLDWNKKKLKSVLWGFSLMLACFIYGGFFKVIDTPQIVFIILLAIDIVICSNKYCKKKTSKYNFYTNGLTALLGISVLYWGGFYS